MSRSTRTTMALGLGTALALTGGDVLAARGGNKPGGGGGDPPAAGNPELVFMESGGKGASLVVADADGGNRRVVLGSGVDRNALPTWSPDGSQIVFRGTADGDGLYVVNVDGTGLTRIVDRRVAFHAPAWTPVPAPDGRYKIAFVDTGAGGTFDIWVVNPDGSGEQNLTNSPDVAELDPTWSWDADRLAVRFANVDRSFEGIMVMDVVAMPEGGITKSETPPSRPLQAPYGSNTFHELDWARRHDWIAYRGGDLDIHVLDLASPGTSWRVTTTGDAAEYDPSWSPDDLQLVFEYSPSNGHGGLRVIDRSGSNAVSLGLDKGSQPSWLR